MKKALILSLLSCSLLHAEEVRVRLTNAPESGIVIFRVFNSANTFGDLRDPIREVRFPLDGRDLYSISDLPVGEIALIVHFDENENGVIDKNFIGIPREAIGFSNDYRPKGPPSFKRAAFPLSEDEVPEFDVRLDKPLGDRGRIGAGVGIIARSSPYKDYNGSVTQVIPAITYTGNRLQIFGPGAQLSLVGGGRFRLAGTANYRLGVYEEDQSDYLEGMGDRDSTRMGGLALQAELPGGVDLSLRYEHDVLDEIGGGTAQLSADKSFSIGILRLGAEVGLNWQSAELNEHDFGVTSAQATDNRAAYLPGDTFSPEAGLSVFIELTRDWLVIMSGSVEWLDNEVVDSPIVADDYVFKGFAALNYLF